MLRGAHPLPAYLVRSAYLNAGVSPEAGPLLTTFAALDCIAV